jgi:hypothetical protein
MNEAREASKVKVNRKDLIFLLGVEAALKLAHSIRDD